jgi:hypothetical protein
MDRDKADKKTPDHEIADVIRTRRLVVVDRDGIERAVLTTHLGHIELRIGMGLDGHRCEVLVFAGEQEPGLFAAGVEFWANGDSIGGSSLTVQGREIDFHRFP